MKEVCDPVRRFLYFVLFFIIINRFWMSGRNFQRFFCSFVRAKLSLVCRIASEVYHELGLLSLKNIKGKTLKKLAFF